MTTLLSAEEQKLHAAANKTKADLDKGVADSVPRGDESMPPMRQDPMALRKAMFKKADAKRAEESQVPVDPETQAAWDQLSAEAANGHAPVADATTVRQRQQREERQPSKVDPQPTATSPAAKKDERVSLKVGESTITVLRDDIERAGGETLYIRRRELDEAELHVNQERARIAQADADLKRRMAEADAAGSNRTGNSPAPGQGDPASLGAHPAPTGQPGNSGVDFAQVARDVASRLYAGDEGEGAKAIENALRVAASQGTVNIDDVVRQVTARIAPAKTEASPATPPAQLNPIIQTINDQINAMSRAEYPELLKDDTARTAAFMKFQEWVKKPENADRRAVDVAREACDWAERTLLNPRGNIIEQKRGLQSPSAASGSYPDANEEARTDPSSVVAQMQDARRFGRRR